MARSLVFGNGRLHIGLDEHGLVADLYFPHVGLESHLQPHGFSHKIGIFADGRLSWLDEMDWRVDTTYHKGTMVGNTTATHEELGLRIEFTDAVDHEATLFVRSIHVVNLRGEAREVTLYCHQAFMLGDSVSSDTVQYRPDLPGIMHYKGKRVFVATLRSESGSFDDFSVGNYDRNGNGTFRDAEDGRLEKNLVETGMVDSIVGCRLTLGAYDSARAEYALVAAETVREAEELTDQFMRNGATYSIAKTAMAWRSWTRKARISPVLNDTERQALETSLVVIAAHLDARGAVMASLDSSLKNHPQDDTYNFCWPRDAMYALWPLLRLGYTDELLAFFDFAVRGLHEDGYLSHKYRADGSLGSTWLPYEHPDGSVHPPIQADETAAVLFLLGQYYRHMNDQAFVVRYYESLVEPMANFLAGNMADDGLPLSSYDIWEHAYETTVYTTALTYASLLEASELAEAYGRSNDAARWRATAEAIQGASDCFYNPETKYFYRGFSRDDSGEKQFDATVDSSSLYGAFMFGLYDLTDTHLETAVQTARECLKNGSLYRRFEGDDYYGESANPNLWPHVSLWMAEIALERDELDEAEAVLEAVLSLASPSGILPEQVDPSSHAPASLAPLVWSHAELISALIDFTQTKRSDA